MGTPRSNETAHQRMSRIFGMGKFGEELAQEIINQAITEYLSNKADQDGPHDRVSE